MGFADLDRMLYSRLTLWTDVVTDLQHRKMVPRDSCSDGFIRESIPWPSSEENVLGWSP